MTRVAGASRRLRAAVVVMGALAVLLVPGSPASANHVIGFSDTRGDANGINDQLEGFCCDVSTPVVSRPAADIVATTIRTLYRDRKPVATQLRITMAGAIKGGGFGYELRMGSARCGSIFGIFSANSGRITEECDTSRTRVTHRVGVHSKGRTLFVRFPYNLNRGEGLLRPGDVLNRFQTISNTGTDPVLLPRLDWSSAPSGMTFNVGQ